MEDTKRGFQHEGTFYELVPVSEWRTQDASLAHRVTGMSTSRLFFSADDNDELLGRSALVAVAMHHARPEVPVEQIVDVVNRAKPMIDFEPVGFSEDVKVPKAGQEGPSLSSSSEASADSTDATSEPSQPVASGRRGSATAKTIPA